MKDNEFVTADLHFGHVGILKHTTRNFASVEEMDRVLIERWNAKVKSGAIVYVLGDVSFYRPDKTRIILGQLNGTLRVVRGNHDKKHTRKPLDERCDWVRDYYESKTASGVRVCMFHYPLLTWNGSYRGSWHLHGHSHGNLAEFGGRRLDIGVDCHPNLEPFSYDEVYDFMATRKF